MDTRCKNLYGICVTMTVITSWLTFSSHTCLFVLYFLKNPQMKVHIAFFFRTGTNVKEAEVICVSSGTKCINGEYMSARGLALNDCHAEIVARRSLIRYLYSQLEHFLR